MYRKFLILILFIFIVRGEVWEGFTIFTPYAAGTGTSTHLLDTYGNIIHQWEHERGPASMPYLLPDSTIIYPYVVQNPSMVAGGVGGGIQIIDWNGNILWDYQIANSQYQQHHDVEPLPNGNILVLTWEKKTANEAYELGRIEINNPINQAWPPAILEIEPLPNNEANVVWEWHAWDHLIQDEYPDLPNYGVISEHPEKFDINRGAVGSEVGGGNGDWFHLNAIDYNEALDQIIVSSRHHDEIFIIDHNTTTEEAASHSGGNCGKGGDFLYRWGNPQNYGHGDESNKQLDDQHSVNWIPSNYPGGGNVILFNNFYTSFTSAVMEWETPLNNEGCYDLNSNGMFGPTEASWIFYDNFQSDRQSGAFRLGNGNTLITDANSTRIFEVDSDGILQWDYTYIGNSNNIPRAQKYPIDYLHTGELLGDVNNDGVINILDVVSTVNIVLGNLDWVDAADYNSDGNINILDIVSIVNVILDN